MKETFLCHKSTALVSTKYHFSTTQVVLGGVYYGLLIILITWILF